VADRNRRQKPIGRARILLLTGAGLGTLSIMRRVGCAKAAVWRWPERFAMAGVDGLLRGQSRPPGRTPVPKSVVERVVELTPCLRPIRRTAFVDRREPGQHPAAPLELVLEFGEREVGRRLDQPAQVGRVRLKHGPPVPAVARRCGAAGRPHPLLQLDRGRRADRKAAARLPGSNCRARPHARSAAAGPWTSVPASTQ
jgi:hypothetical protein